MSDLSHIDDEGRARMVDVTEKRDTVRMARARGEIRMRETTLAAIRENALAKGDVLGAARIAAVMAAKRTPDLIPLCHPLLITDVQAEITADSALPGIRVETTVRCTGKTGVEMEALVAAAAALLTIYDMAKAIDREMVISGIELVEKSGGRSGRWNR